MMRPRSHGPIEHCNCAIVALTGAIRDIVGGLAGQRQMVVGPVERGLCVRMPGHRCPHWGCTKAGPDYVRKSIVFGAPGLRGYVSETERNASDRIHYVRRAVGPLERLWYTESIAAVTGASRRLMAASDVGSGLYTDEISCSGSPPFRPAGRGSVLASPIDGVEPHTKG
jgi:hypothetical protein